jgi:hypothetical protein
VRHHDAPSSASRRGKTGAWAGTHRSPLRGPEGDVTQVERTRVARGAGAPSWFRSWIPPPPPWPSQISFTPRPMAEVRDRRSRRSGRHRSRMTRGIVFRIRCGRDADALEYPADLYAHGRVLLVGAPPHLDNRTHPARATSPLVGQLRARTRLPIVQRHSSSGHHTHVGVYSAPRERPPT